MARWLHTHPVVRLLLPVFALVIVTLPFAFSDLDLRISSHFYDAAGDKWTLSDSNVVAFLYEFATYPTTIAAYTGLGIALLSFPFPALRTWRRAALFLFLALVVGPGLLVNGVGKGMLDRARPREVVEFGGDKPFQRLWHFPAGAEGRSFPSGHASSGFLWLAPAVYYRARRPRLAIGLVALAVVHGSALGYARIAAGGHFMSDVLWAGGADYIAGVMLCLAFGYVASARGRHEDYAYDVLGRASPIDAPTL